MNNKSTENLINSDGSIEELFVPPSDLTKTNKPPPASTKKSNNTFCDAEEKSPVPELALDLPIPARRKSVLPAISSDCSKDSKNDRNRKTRQKLSSNEADKPSGEKRAAFAVVNERKKCFENVQSLSASESETNVPNSKRSSVPESDTITTKPKAKVRRQLTRKKSIEEVASFVSYEEKHEKEDNSEHLLIENVEQANNDNHTNEMELKTIEPNRTLNKRMQKKRNKKTTKRSKQSKELVGEHNKAMDESIANEPDAIDEPYDFKKIIGKFRIKL